MTFRSCWSTRQPSKISDVKLQSPDPQLKILLVRLRLIGDVVFTTPIVRALRRRFPEAGLTYLVESGAASVIATNRHLNEILIVPHTRGRRRVNDESRLGPRLPSAPF